MSDDWESVGGPPAQGEDWETVRADPIPSSSDQLPPAFLERVGAGQAVNRIMSAAAAGAKEGFGQGNPTGFEDATLAHLIEKGIFHDPATGRPGPLQFTAETLAMPAAQLWQLLNRTVSAGAHGLGAGLAQGVRETAGEQGIEIPSLIGIHPNRVERETVAAVEWAMIEGGMGRFSRPSVDGAAVMDKTVGTLPTPQDFAAASDVLTTPKSGVTLREAPEGGVYTPEQVNAAKGEKYFKVYDANGNVKAEALVKIDGKTANIEDILAPGKPRDEGRGALGSADLRSVLRQFQDQHPEIEKITGERVSGASAGGGYSLLDERRQVEMNLRRMWSEDGIHPAEAVHDAETDGFLKHEITAPHEEIEATPTLANYTKDENGVIRYEGDYGEEALIVREIPQSMAGSRGMFASNFSEEAAGKYIAIRSRDGQQQTLFGGGWVSNPEKPLLFDTAAEAEAAAKQRLGLNDAAQPFPKDWNVKSEEIEQAFGEGASLSAAVTPPEEIPVDVQPPRPAGSLIASAQKAVDTLFDVGRDIQMKLAPMAAGSRDSMATVKDFMNAQRRNAWDASRIDTDLLGKFSGAERERLANAMEEESLSLRLEEPASAREHQGLATLTPEERATVEGLNERQQLAWLRARDLGMVEGDGIAMHYPRMVVGIPKGLDKSTEGSLSLTAIGYDLRSRTPFTKQRKHLELEQTEKAIKDKIGMQLAKQGKSADEISAALEKVKVVRDIRAVNLATKQLEDAVAGRTLIKNIQEVGKRTGEDTVAEGFDPGGWFTMDHPSFKTWRPKLEEVDGKSQAVKDSAGNPVFEQVPIYVRGDFEGPLRAAMWGDTGAAYGAAMALKGKTMGLIMNSPMIHNLVELGRAVPAIMESGGVLGLPALPIRVVKTYMDGYRAKHDVGLMHEAINAGLVPIGKRFFNQDINAVMETPDLTPGRSWTAKVLAAVPGLFDEAAGTAVKQAIDKAGDFWHNTLLWDRIADLQMGLYTNFRGDLISHGMDARTASRMAAHWANRYAGALPKEAMSEAATKIANVLFFSRSFTFGNLGVMKDMLTGLPRDVMAQIERDAGLRAGAIEGADVEGAVQEAAKSARSIARRKAMMVVGLDMALMYAGNSVFQSALNIMRGKSSSQEEHDYLRRAQDVINDVKVHPLSLLNPLFIGGIPGRLSSTADNEPGKQNRIQIGLAKDGTAIYARNPIGKIGDEFAGYFDGPLDMLRKKEGTIARPLSQIYTNDAGFGRKIYDQNAETLTERAGALFAMVKHLVQSQLPVGQLQAAHDLVTGEGDKFVNELQAFGPFAGVTFSKGAPGGPAVGEMYDVKSRREFAISQAMPDLRRQIQRGDIAGAQQVMGRLGMDASYQRWVIKTSLDPRLRLSPRSIRDFYSSATGEQKARFERAQGTAPAP